MFQAERDLTKRAGCLCPRQNEEEEAEVQRRKGLPRSPKHVVGQEQSWSSHSQTSFEALAQISFSAKLFSSSFPSNPLLLAR